MIRKVLAVVALTVALSASRSFAGDAGVDPAAKNGGKTTEVCVTNAAGGTYVPGNASTHSPLQGRRAVELQNLGPNAIFCTVDGQAPLSTGALGRKLDASGGTWSHDAGKNIVLRCIAATAAQATPACTQVSELR